jgi:hypothetical protein
MAGEIWLGDLARAFAALGPATDKERHSIARLLGVGAPERATAHEQVSPARVEQGEEITDVTGLGDRADQAAGPPAAPANLSLLTPLTEEQVSAALESAQPLPRPGAGQPMAVSQREPLLPPRSAAAILLTMIARNTEDGPLDVAAIVEMLARRQAIDRMPREVRPTLRFGVQVLVDLGLAMQPFAQDQIQVVAQVRDVAGPERTSVLYFADSPARGAGPGPRRTWRRYQPPERGTRVIVLSDCGLSGPVLHPQRSQPEEWRSLVGQLRRAECDLVALLPQPVVRWPRWLSTLMPLVCWDRSTTSASVSSSVGGAPSSLAWP